MISTKKLSILVAFGAVTLFFILIFFKPKVMRTEIKEEIWPVEVLTVKKTTHEPNLRLYGTIQTPQLTILESSIMADVETVKTSIGDLVTKGQTLINLDNEDVSLILKQRISDLTEITAIIKSEKERHAATVKSIKEEKKLIQLKEKALYRQQKLAQKNFSSPAALENAELMLSQQKLSLIQMQLQLDNYANVIIQLEAKKNKILALIDLAKHDLERTIIKAPFQGMITNVFVAKGSKAKVGQRLLGLYALNNIEIRSFIPLKYVKNVLVAIKDNKKLLGYFKIHGHKVNIQLNKLAGHVEQARGGLDAFFNIQKPYSALAIGQSVEVLLHLNTINDAIRIPVHALYDNNKIYLINNEYRLKALTIKPLGTESIGKNTYVIFKSNEIKDNDKILINKLPNARSNMLVNVINSQNEQ